ncbi:hypothetical protein [Candidatus Sororendozoicomonas aggregata]|uniref:hypothetical protein n=1 Tax=Candidatus Sororendozoicomonas aggregata TaxID=3073239 RepID=UPI002ED1CC9C
MSQVKINVGKRGEHDSKKVSQEDLELKALLERLKKKGLNPMQICQKLTEHKVSPPTADAWSYSLVVEHCKRLNVQ